jgi:M6 family metalloprotease-like protein
MIKTWLVGVCLCGSVAACSSAEPSTNGAGGGGAGGGSSSGAGTGGSNGGAALTGGSGGSVASGGSASGSAGAGSADWPSYEEAAAAPQSTKLLVLLLDFADSDQNTLLPDAEGAWGKMMFGREQSNGNHYFYQASAGQFQLLPATETQGAPNNGVVHIKVSQSKPTTGTLVAEEQPWLLEAIDASAKYVDYASFDRNADGKLSNAELSVFVVINWEFEQIALAPAQANIIFNHAIPGTGVTLEKFARDMYLHTSIGIAMHELGHHILDWDHTPSPTDHDLMGQGSYWPDPKISTLHDPNWFNATRPTHPKAMHKLRAGWVKPTPVTESLTGVKLYAPELGKQYNVIQLPVTQGFLTLENRTAQGYDASIPFCNGETGALFVDDVSQYLDPLDLTVEHLPSTAPEIFDRDVTLCDVYALAGHNGGFSFGGWKISNVSAPGPVMTVDIEKLPVTPAIDHYRFEAWYLKDGQRERRYTRLDGAASTIDFSTLDGGSAIGGFVSIGVNAYYTTGEVRSVALSTTYTSDSPYFELANAGEFTNGGAPTADSLTYVTIHPDQPHVSSAKVTFQSGTLNHTITFTNLPQN